MNTQMTWSLDGIRAHLDSPEVKACSDKDSKRTSADLRTENALIVFMYTKLHFERNSNGNFVF